QPAGEEPLLSGAVVTPAAARAGVRVFESGAVSLPLACPDGQTCMVSGELTFSTGALRVGAARASAASKTQLLARFRGVRVSGGRVGSLRLRLPRSFVKAAQRAGVRTVRATLVLRTTFGNGRTISRRQQISLTIPRARAAQRRAAPKPARKPAQRPSF